ncbi:MAG: NEW3 domain-containing protein [Candidatus Polarisedimenticolia bacterium]|nr:NEW3 domain-containing protein [bacterium]
MRRRSCLLVGLLSLAAACGVAFGGADGTSGGERSLLELEKQKVALRTAQADYDRVVRMFGAGLMSRADLDRESAKLETARLSFQQSMVDVLALRPRVGVVRAVKYRAADGKKRIRVEIQNDTRPFDPREFGIAEGAGAEGEVARAVGERSIHDLFVSLSASASSDPATSAARGTIIALPYQRCVRDLPVGQPAVLDFELLRDVSSVSIQLEGRGIQSAVDIELEQELGGGGVTLTSTQVSQEADLGSEAKFRLVLERSSVDERSFWLKAINLPPQAEHAFVDSKTDARLTRIQVPAGTSHVEMELRVALPAAGDERIPVGRPLTFWAVVGDDSVAQAFAEGRAYSDREIQSSHVAAVRLELTPRGMGKLEVTAPTLLVETGAGDSVDVPLEISNTGSCRLDNLRVKVDAPSGWETQATPPTVASLDVGQKTSFAVRVVPPDGATVGDYEVRLRPECSAHSVSLDLEPKVLRVAVRSHGGVLRGLALLALVGGVVGWLLVRTLRRARQ